MTQIDYQQEVKKVYPDAECRSNYSMKGDCLFRYWIAANGKKITPYFNVKEQSWQSAYNILKNQGKL